MLTRKDGKTDITRLSAIVDQIAWLRSKGHEVILVSSGAVSCGQGELAVDHKLDSVERRQLFSAIGQVKLIGIYYNLFREHGIHVAQVLTMKECFATRALYLNQRSAMEVMLSNGVLPIVNENDTISVTELMFTDNDELSGLIASMLDSDALVILSNIDGIYTGNPADPQSSVIREIHLSDDISGYIQSGKSGFGRGGMITKAGIARRVAEEGIKVVIANGKRDDILISLAEHPDETVHTTFIPSKKTTPSVKKWLAHSSSFAKGTAHINRQAAEALEGENAVSLLFVGITAIEGDFEEGDIVNIEDPEGNIIALGRTGFSSEEARALIGKHNVKPFVHYDYLFMES